MAGKDPVGAVYAKALLEAAHADVQGTEAAFDAFLQAWQAVPELRTFLLAPGIGADKKRGVLGEALKGAPVSFLNFLGLVVDKGRASSLPAIHSAFRDLRDEAQNRVRARASTAVAMSGAQEGQVAAALGQALKREIILESSVKPELLGGIRLQIGDWVADGTLQRRLRELSKQVQHAPAAQGAWAS